MKEYPPKTHGVVLIAALFFAILLASCEQPKKNAAPSAKTATTETVTTAETAAVPAETKSTSIPPEPTIADIVALSNAMHGAVSQQPDDAPKDQYGEPYIIGNLGGFPVNLPASVVSLVEYDDSPGWDMEKLRNYKPPKRTYQSIIDSFSFRLHYRDNILLDDKKNLMQYKQENSMPNSLWIRVGISSGTRFHKGEYVWDRFLNSDKKRGYSSDSPVYTLKTTEKYFDLDQYIVPGINEKNGIPWRENKGADDVFVHVDSNGHIDTYIRCSNNQVPQPPCDHYFTVYGKMKVDVSLLYYRPNLHNWKLIQDAVNDAIYGFVSTSNYATKQ